MDVGALDGIIYLDLIDNDSISATGSGLPLGEAGLINGDYYDGEVAVVDEKGVPMPLATPYGLLLLVLLITGLAGWRVRRARAVSH